MFAIDGTLAYIDPGTGGVFLQLLIAGVVGAAFFFRRALGRVLGLFPGKKKKTEITASHAESE